MRILIISNYYPPVEMGGWPQLTSNIVDHLSERGHQTLVLTSRHQKERIKVPEQGIRRVLHLQNPDHNYYHARYLLTERWHDHENLHYVRQAATNFKPDVMFIHGLWNMSRKLVLDLERLYPNQIVYYVASTWPVEMDVHTSYWTSPTKRLWLRLPKRVLGTIVRQTLLSNIPSQSLKFKRVLCVSKFIQNCLVDQAGIPIQNTQVVHNGVDVKEFIPKPDKSKGNNKLELIYAGGFWEHKGVTSAIESVDHLVNKLDVRNFHLTLVGSGHPAYVSSMMKQINESGLINYISFKDYVSRDKMPALLASYDLLLFPSIGSEALPRIVQEAMACGLLVIGSTAGGTPEILVDGKNGLAFKAGDSKMLAEKIALAASDPDLRTRLARAARSTVEENFTIEAMVDKIEDYLTKIVNSE